FQRPEARRFAPFASHAEAPQRPEPRQAPAPEPRQQQPPQQPALGTPRQDRAGIVALFLVHMFPIGHLPVATSEPARQLPPPAHGVDPFAALRFEPHDHPRSAVFDDAEAHPGRADDAEGLSTSHPAVAATLGLYDALAGLHERDWDRRYLVKDDPRAPEYAWPPGEAFPEGCYEPGEPVMLEPGTLLDRFGDPHGRVFGEDGAAYRKRSLPPPGAQARYRRYRVLLELPSWRGITAPWFGQQGSGVRYRTVYPARDLVVLGYLQDVTDSIESTESGPQAGGTA
ncbi:MAG: TNT domain-containing protein, partial [Thermocrispum sp.]